MEREAAGLVIVGFILSFIDFIIYAVFPFPSECCILCCGGWMCGGFGGAYILYVLVQMAFFCLLCFGIVFVYILSEEGRPAYIISCTD